MLQEGQLLHSSADVSAALRLLADAPDEQSFFAALPETLPWLLPATRVDILAAEQGETAQLLFTWGAPAEPLPVPAEPTPASLAGWLDEAGYRSIITLPLGAAGQHYGWLLLSRRNEPFAPDTLALAGQLAALIGLRLMCDRCRRDLEDRDTYIALLERRLHESEEMRLRATLAAGAAHDIGNLFSAVMGHAQLLQHSAPPPMQPDLRTIVRAARDGHHLMRRMIALRVPNAVASPTAHVLLPTIVRDAIELTRPFWEDRPEITIETMLAPAPAVRGHAAELREVLINLIMNALTAMPTGGTLSIRTYGADSRALVEVRDTGAGIARELQSTIFQPFVSTREAGSGLGLSVSRAIIEGYGGTLDLDSAPGQGALFTLALPAVGSLDALHEGPPLSHKQAAS